MTPLLKSMLLRKLSATVPVKPPKLSKEEIMERLGLMSFDEFRSNSIFDGHRLRAFGRTTAMLVDALYHAQTEKVLVCGWSGQYSNSLQQDLLSMATKAGVTTKNIVVAPVLNTWLDKAITQRYARGSELHIFRDHHYAGRPAYPQRSSTWR